ncbi:MAG: hypothetical protein NT121_11675 [Chloroflexi bacterium]|nr:hypothetical protein [Chloroflexota bacterium]
MLKTAQSILSGLRVDERALARNLAIYGPFAATERVLMAAVKAGANRQDMHEIIREQAMRAWESVRNGEPNPLRENLLKDAQILEFLSAERVQTLMDYSSHLGDAPKRARQLVKTIQNEIDPN